MASPNDKSAGAPDRPTTFDYASAVLLHWRPVVVAPFAAAVVAAAALTFPPK